MGILTICILATYVYVVYEWIVTCFQFYTLAETLINAFILLFVALKCMLYFCFVFAFSLPKKNDFVSRLHTVTFVHVLEFNILRNIPITRLTIHFVYSSQESSLMEKLCFGNKENLHFELSSLKTKGKGVWFNLTTHPRPYETNRYNPAIQLLH